ncbi:hypothetical protein WICMUC_003911 [Wickerhamomyces mucosus]|uniref:HTH CENPB-type domain-containing protein n=1 Tax=Wickerhamomyces mucosus TaxID=1378264 RepID=A0A9P8PIT2_9ASCO|nr:hypothetical protein WICMUC_003911 [Wickerhamomyces mucosus]
MQMLYTDKKLKEYNEREERFRLAVEEASTNKTASINSIANKYKVSRTTLSRRIHGFKNTRNSHEKQQKFTNSEELEIVEKIQRLLDSDQPVPPKGEILTICESLLQTKYKDEDSIDSESKLFKVGKNWIDRFLERHNDKLKINDEVSLSEYYKNEFLQKKKLKSTNGYDISRPTSISPSNELEEPHQIYPQTQQMHYHHQHQQFQQSGQSSYYIHPYPQGPQQVLQPPAQQPSAVQVSQMHNSASQTFARPDPFLYQSEQSQSTPSLQQYYYNHQQNNLNATPQQPVYKHGSISYQYPHLQTYPSYNSNTTNSLTQIYPSFGYSSYPQHQPPSQPPSQTTSVSSSGSHLSTDTKDTVETHSVVDKDNGELLMRYYTDNKFQYAKAHNDIILKLKTLGHLDSDSGLGRLIDLSFEQFERDLSLSASNWNINGY